MTEETENQRLTRLERAYSDELGKRVRAELFLKETTKERDSLRKELNWARQAYDKAASDLRKADRQKDEAITESVRSRNEATLLRSHLKKTTHALKPFALAKGRPARLAVSVDSFWYANWVYDQMKSIYPKIEQDLALIEHTPKD